MEKSQIEAIERAMREEHRRDMEALERLKRFLPNGSATATAMVMPLVEPQEERQERDDSDEGEPEGAPSTLRGEVGKAMAADPSQSWTGRKMLRHLQGINFPFKAKKPLNSIVVAMAYWVKRDYAAVVRKGVGRAPNMVRWKTGRAFPLESSHVDS